MDLTFGTLMGSSLLSTITLDLAFVGIIGGFFLLSMAYIAGCERLRKGDKG